MKTSKEKRKVKTQLLTADDVASLLSVSRSLVYNWAETGEIECLRLGKSGCRGTLRFTLGHVNAMLRKQGQDVELEAHLEQTREDLLDD